MSDMNLPLSTIDEQCLVEEGLADLPIVRLKGAKHLILIGQDNVQLLIILSDEEGLEAVI